MYNVNLEPQLQLKNSKIIYLYFICVYLFIILYFYKQIKI